MIIKIAQICVCILTLAFFLVSLHMRIERFIFRIWSSILFYVTGIGLMVTSYNFLKQLKKYNRSDYEEKHTNIKLVTFICSTIILLKGVGITLCLIHSKYYGIEDDQAGYEGIHTLFDVIELI
mmetsp:Transcript_24078/g.27780  ORF Transcript_24078/g.27780 Transcript_24078/m.27780 type:complete len:123 (+) Transcript_24078:393-761(+)